MKKYIFTEGQVKKVIDHLINEQKTMSPEDSFNAVYNNPRIKDQMKKFPPNTNFGFSTASLPKVDIELETSIGKSPNPSPKRNLCEKFL